MALVTACGSSDDDGSDTTAAQATSAVRRGGHDVRQGGTAAAGAAPVVVAHSALGQILTTADGFTVYGFKNDSAGTSTCTGGCG